MRMKKIFKSKIFFLVVISFISLSVVFAYSYLAEEVGFTPTDNTWDVDNTKDALDDLHFKVDGCTSTLAGTIFNYAYSGIENTFVTPCRGKYKIEVWGAQGASYTANNLYGGYGGYSIGYAKFDVGQKLFITVGSAGNDVNAGYNGGGAGSKRTVTFAGGGGGASHVALASGLLKNLSSNSVLIVAGGGAGAYYYSNKAWNGNSGGGYWGGYSNDMYTAGRQDGGYAFGTAGTTLDSSYNYSGAGGGYWGGFSYYGEAGAGGGSGYIGSSRLIANTSTDIHNKMFCYNCIENSGLTIYTVASYGTTAHQSERNSSCSSGYSSSPISSCAKAGNGYVRITYLGK